MILFQTKVQVADNSGARLVQCIKVLKKGHKYARVGDQIVVAVKRAQAHKKIKVGEVHRAIVIRTKAPVYNLDGSLIKFADNAVVMLNHKQEPFATRIIGPISRELRQSGMTKLLSLASSIY